jgi:hypothetical protein
MKSLQLLITASAALLAAATVTSSASAQGSLPRNPDPGSPSTASPIKGTTGSGSSNTTAEDSKPKRRANAGERDDILNKGDPTAFDGYKGHRVKLSARVSETSMSEYTKCILKARGKSVDAFLKTIPDSPESQKPLKALLIDQCISNQLFNLTEVSLDQNLLRASLFDHLYSREMKENAVAINYAQLGPSDLAAEFGTVIANVTPAVTLQRKLGDCVVRQATDQARELLAVPIWDKEESLRFKAITPVMAQCLPEGAQLKFSRTMMRGMLAESLLKFAARSQGSLASSRN